jgi:hypothetical protein
MRFLLRKDSCPLGVLVSIWKGLNLGNWEHWVKGLFLCMDHLEFGQHESLIMVLPFFDIL